MNTDMNHKIINKCTEYESIFVLELLLEPRRSSSWPYYYKERFLWKVEDKRGQIIFGGNDYYDLWEPKNETFCVPTNACYEITVSKRISGFEGGYKLYSTIHSDDTLLLLREKRRRYYSFYDVENTPCQTSYPSTFPPIPPSVSPLISTKIPTSYSVPSVMPTISEPFFYNDYSPEENENGDTISFISVVFVLFVSFCWIYSACKYESRRSEDESNQTPGRITTQQQNSDNNHNLTSDEEEKQERRFKILTSIICKKVLPKQELPHIKSLSIRGSKVQNISCDSELFNHSDDIFPIPFPVVQSQSHTNKNDIKTYEEDIIVAPANNFPPSQSQHEQVITSYTNSDDNFRQKDDFKNDIYEQSVRSFRMAMDKKTASSSSLYSPNSCPICMESYKAGDEIAWSKNEDCVHAFHLECILDWLMENDDCPMCRGDYLYGGKIEV